METEYEDVVVCIRLFHRMGGEKENRKVNRKVNLQDVSCQPSMWKERNNFPVSVGPGYKTVWPPYMFSLCVLKLE